MIRMQPNMGISMVFYKAAQQKTNRPDAFFQTASGLCFVLTKININYAV